MHVANRGTCRASQQRGSAADVDDATRSRAVRIQLNEFAMEISERDARLEGDPEKLRMYIETEQKLTADHAALEDERTNLAATSVTLQLAKLGRSQAKRLVGSSGLPTADRFKSALREVYASGGVFDWLRFSRDVSVLFVEVPPSRVLLGPTDVPPVVKEVKARDAAKKRAKDAAPVEREVAEKLQAGETMAGGEAKNASRSEDIHRALLKVSAAYSQRILCSDGKTRRVMHLMRVLVDPWSYSQTIENFFYFSHLVKSPVLAGVWTGADGEPYFRVYPYVDRDGVVAIDYASDVDGEADTEGPAPTASTKRGRTATATSVLAAGVDFKSRQFAVQLDPAAWAKICAHYELAAPVLPHRRSSDTTASENYQFANSTPLRGSPHRRPTLPAATARGSPLRVGSAPAAAGKRRRPRDADAQEEHDE